MSSSDIDTSKDYYKALGILATATQEEIKNAYLQLALRHHPDVAGNSKENSDKFKEIQEAFSFLSKIDQRTAYDNLLRPIIRQTTGDNKSVSWTVTENVYSTQKTNHAIMAKELGNSWRGNLDKYKTEKWIKMPLSEKKLKRSLPLNSFGGMLAYAGAFFVFTGAAGVVLYAMLKAKPKDNRKLG
eukprot:gene1943-3770_t